MSSHEFSSRPNTDARALMETLPESINAGSQAVVIDVGGRPQGFLLHPKLLDTIDPNAILAGARMPAHVLREALRPELVQAFGPNARPTIARATQPGERIRPLRVPGSDVANLELFGERVIAPLEWTLDANNPNGGTFSLTSEPSPYVSIETLPPADRVAAQITPVVSGLATQIASGLGS